MVTRNGNTIKFRHILRCIGKDIPNDTHRDSRWINVRITHHEFFQNIILDSSGHNGFIYTLFFTSKDIERHNWQYSTIHGHGYGHLVKRNTGEQNFHIEDGVYRNAGLTNVTDNARMIRVIAPMCSQVKGDRQTFLTSCKVSTIECIGFFRSGETGVLTYCPRPSYIHRRIWSTKERRNTSHVIQMGHTFIIHFCIQRFHSNLFHRSMI